MSAKESDHELTSTLHLGVRSVVGSSPANLVDLFLNTAQGEEKAAIEAILIGAPDKAMIIIHRGPAKGSRFLITSEGAAIGRSTVSAIFLDDITVSRKHALIVAQGKSFELRDLGSLNGTYVNNLSATSVTLKSGDEIQIGKYHMLFIGARQGENK